jgi:hypothetical protein
MEGVGMVFFYHKWLARLRLVILFLILTFLVYQILLLITNWTMPNQKYKPPGGKAVKVFHYVTESGSMTDRLRLFYWYGE